MAKKLLKPTYYSPLAFVCSLLGLLFLPIGVIGLWIGGVAIYRAYPDRFYVWSGLIITLSNFMMKIVAILALEGLV